MSYWQERAEQSIKRMESRLNDNIPELVDSFNHAKRELAKEINSFYGRYAKENKISLAEAQKQLDFNELKEFKGDLKSFKDLSYKSIGTYNLELNNLSIKARITRLQALEFQCDTILQRLYQQMQDKITQTVTDVYTEQFYRSQYSSYQYGGFQHSFAKVNESAIKKVLETPVQGADISTRLWRQDLDIGFKIRQTLNTMFTTGKPPQYFADELQKVIGRRDKDGDLTGKKYEAYRLLYNESSFAVTQADLEAYKIDGVEEYEICATLDLITSTICREMDGKRFPIEKAVVGENCPPLHVNCRSTTVPHYPWVKGGTRIARDKDGKNITVEKMNYGEWKAKYIDKDSADGIIKVGRDKMNVGINSIENPIEQRNTAKGNPNAIMLFDRPLNNRQQLLFDMLPQFNSKAVISKKAVSMKDLSALTAYTGDEFAMFTKGQERMIIRGNANMVDIDEAKANSLAKEGYKWSGHTHPGVNDLCLTPSDGDYRILDCFKNATSVVMNSKGEFRTFEKRG